MAVRFAAALGWLTGYLARWLLGCLPGCLLASMDMMIMTDCSGHADEYDYGSDYNHVDAYECDYELEREYDSRSILWLF